MTLQGSSHIETPDSETSETPISPLGSVDEQLLSIDQNCLNITVFDMKNKPKNEA